jgi:hypothetical protein
VRADTVDGDDWILHRSCMRDGAVDASGDWRLVAIIEAAPDAGGSQKATVSLKSSQVKSIKVRYFIVQYD